MITDEYFKVYNKPLEHDKYYLAHIVGITYMGSRKEFEFFGRNPLVVPQVMLSFELLGIDTLETPTKPKLFHKVFRLSNHPKSSLFKLVEEIKPECISKIYEDEPYFDDQCNISDKEVSFTYNIDLEKITYEMVSAKVKESTRRKGIPMFTSMKKPCILQRSLIREAPITTPFIYDVVTDNLICGNRKDLPTGLINYAKETMEK